MNKGTNHPVKKETKLEKYIKGVRKDFALHPEKYPKVDESMFESKPVKKEQEKISSCIVGNSDCEAYGGCKTVPSPRPDGWEELDLQENTPMREKESFKHMFTVVESDILFANELHERGGSLEAYLKRRGDVEEYLATFIQGLLLSTRQEDAKVFREMIGEDEKLNTEDDYYNNVIKLGKDRLKKELRTALSTWEENT